MRMTISAAALIVAASMLGGSAAFAAQAAPQGDATKGKANFERVGSTNAWASGQGGPRRPRSPIRFLGLARFAGLGAHHKRRHAALHAQGALRCELIDIYAYLQSVPKAPDFKSIPLLSQQITAANTPAR